MSVVINGTPFEDAGALAVALGRRRELSERVAESVLPVVERNFVTLSATNRNKWGARGGFWNLMLSGTIAVATESAAMIRMPAPVRLRHLGGTVRPKKAKFLAIPARSEAYGKSPRQFNDLMFRPTARGGMLVRRHRTKLRKKRGGGFQSGGEDGGEAMYFLVKEVTVRANDAVLPRQEAILSAALEGADAFTEMALREL